MTQKWVSNMLKFKVMNIVEMENRNFGSFLYF